LSDSLKRTLNEIVDNLEKVATQVIAIEMALVESKTLADGVIATHYAADAHILASEHLSQARHLIRLLPGA
jgi:hypothetical protein